MKPRARGHCDSIEILGLFLVPTSVLSVGEQDRQRARQFRHRRRAILECDATDGVLANALSLLQRLRATGEISIGTDTYRIPAVVDNARAAPLVAACAVPSISASEVARVDCVSTAAIP